MPDVGTRPSGTLHGRDVELAALDRLLDDVATDRASVVVLRGEAGAGKTVLLDRAAATARDRGFTALRRPGSSSSGASPSAASSPSSAPCSTASRT